MLRHKATQLYSGTLDRKVAQLLRGKALAQDFHLYVIDVACRHTLDIPDKFFDSACDVGNTWNRGLDLAAIDKDRIAVDSQRFGFGSVAYAGGGRAVVKGRSHTCTQLPDYQAHIMSGESEIAKLQRNPSYIVQRVLNGGGRELNVFLLRDLRTRQLHFLCYYAVFDPTRNVNRKLTACRFEAVPEQQVEGVLAKLRAYADALALDYARVELIHDTAAQEWFLIDINNSPGGGPLTNIAAPKVAQLLERLCAPR